MSDSRSEFEAWAISGAMSIALLDRFTNYPKGSYEDSRTHAAWLGWQASRWAALEEAAKACEEEAHPRTIVDNEDGALACLWCAEAIRAYRYQGTGDPAMKQIPNLKYRMTVVPDDDRRPPKITAQIRALETKKTELDRKDIVAYKLAKRDLNREIYRLSKIGLPVDLSWRNDDGRPPFLPREQGSVTCRLTSDQIAFCQRMSPKGNVSMGVRACIDFTMASRQLPVLPSEFDDA